MVGPRRREKIPGIEGITTGIPEIMRMRLTLADYGAGMEFTSWEIQRQKSNELIKELREKLSPNEQTRDWGQIGTCQGLLTSFEIMVRLAELAKTWIGSPETPLQRLAEEVYQLKEEWTKDESGTILALRREIMS
jgi:hypothetical protein